MVFDRSQYQRALSEIRRRTEAIFSIASPEAYYSRPIALRNPLVFYEGHIPAFALNVLRKIALGESGVDERLEILFARGIDPEDEASVPSGTNLWPTREEVQNYVARAKALIDESVANCDLQRSDGPWLNQEPLHNIFEHELMHQETFLYMLHQLPLDLKRPLEPFVRSAATPPASPGNATARIEAGPATLGRDRDGFGWDNEYESFIVDVDAFDVDVHSVTNGDFLQFVEENGYGRRELWSDDSWRWVSTQQVRHPRFWERDGDGKWMRIEQFARSPLPLNAPVYATQAEATAYAKWRGKRLPTEAEYHRAAFCTPEGEERQFPWGSEAPSPKHGNFGFQHWDPVEVGSYPAGASAWGVHDLIGNGWEWTASVFAPFDGFRPMLTYQEYSADFFDGRHYVLKGGSPVTHGALVRRSFRNWFRDTYPFVYAKFRCVS